MIQSLLPGLVFSLVFFTFPWWTPLLQASSYDQKGNIYRLPIAGSIDEDGVSIRGQEVKVDLAWGAYTHYRHAGDFVLLYQNKNCFNIFTRSLFEAAEWERFLKILEARFPKAR
jgi:hypothetical protein